MNIPWIPRRIALAVSAAAMSAAFAAGCTTTADAAADTATADEETSEVVTQAVSDVDGTETAAEVIAANEEVHSSEGADYDASSATTVTLSGDTASVDGDGATADGSMVTITEEGTYVLSGSLTDGQIVIEAEEAKVKLVLDGADITSSTGAAIAAYNVDELTVVLADGTENALSDASSYTDGEDEADGALFSAGNLTLIGEGSLDVTGNAGDGVVSNDGLLVESGTLTIAAADDGLRGKDYIAVTGGDIAVDAAGDGLKSDRDDDAALGWVLISGGTLDVTAGADGVQAATDLVMTGGTVAVTTGGGSGTTAESSAKGFKSGVLQVLEGGALAADSADDTVHSNGAVHFNGTEATLASGDDGVHADTYLVIDTGTITVEQSYEGIEANFITVNGGTTAVAASDDGFNASAGSTEDSTTGGTGMGGAGMGDDGSTLTFTGGTVTVDAEGDGLDSNGTLAISGGTITVDGPEGGGNGALDSNGGISITGGTLRATDSGSMTESPSADSEQSFIAAALDLVSAGSQVTVTDADGNEITSVTAAKNLASLVYSASAIEAGETYTITVDGTEAATTTAGEALEGMGMPGGGEGGGRPGGQ